MKFLFYVLPILAGIALTVQSGINSQLRAAIQHPFVAAFISFLVGTLALALILAFSKSPYPSMETFRPVSWYKFSGGLFGVFVVTVTLLAVARIGAANMFVLIIAGQLTTALVLDHFGLLGMRENPITMQKLFGILLLVCGAYIVNRR